MALINGSPCAAALVADVALAGQARLALAESVFALAVEAARAPLEAYSADLEPLWDDEHETAALRSLRGLLAGGADGPPGAPGRGELPHPAARARPAAPRAGRGRATRRRSSLRSVTDNPVYVLPDADRPLGAVISTGGYHNARAPAAMDGVGSAWADLCQLAQRLTDKLLQHPSTASAARARRVDDEAAAHGADRLGRGGARARRPDAPVARRVRPERRAVDELPRLAPRRRDRPLPGRRARDPRRSRRAGAARRGPGAAAGARRARR